jgi:hypothetical protein
MPKTAEQRAKKFEVKFDADVVRSRFAVTKDLAVTQQQARQAELTDLRNTVRQILDVNGVPSLQTVLYLSFANRIYGLKRTYSGGTLDIEVKGARDLWVLRGANVNILNSIISALGISPPA